MKKFCILVLAILIGFIGYTYWNDKETKNPAIQEVKIELPIAQEEIDTPVTARVDISTPLTGDAQFEAYLDGAETPLNESAWMPKFNVRGIVAQKTSESMDIAVKALNDTKIYISLKGKDQRNENNKIMENWVKYTAFTIDGEPVLTEPVEVWHNKPFKHTLNAKAGETYKLHFEWTKADK